jgi:hypothetical protein
MEETKKKFPIKPVLLGLGAVGAGHLLGYASAGAVTKALGNTRLGNYLRGLPPEARQKLLSRALMGTTAALATGKILRDLSRDRYIEQERTKTASVDVVHYAYQRALELR